MIRPLRHSLQLLHIGWVLALYRRRPAAALQRLGPTYIKLGQTLSTRPDIVGAAAAADLAQLRDALPAFSTAQAKKIIAEGLGAPVTQLFASFQEKPVAAASIAQVHLAVTAEGREVAVKVMRPGVREAFRRDLELLRWLAKWAARRPKFRRLKPVEVVESFAETVVLELDLRFEAAAAVELRENLKRDEGFHVPEVEWNLTSERALTLERIHGTPIDKVELLRAAGHDLAKLQKILAESFFKQAFRDGFFHADLHPGNLFVQADGRIAVVDFGIMGRLEKSQRIYVAEILRGFLEGDYHRVAAVHLEAGYVPAHHSAEQFAQACRAIGQPILGRPLNEISVGKLLAQLFQVTERFDMETQPQLLLLQKTLVMVEGVGRMLDPSVNMWQMAEPLIEDWAREHLGPMAQVKMHLSEMRDFVQRVPTLLRRAERILEKMENCAESA